MSDKHNTTPNILSGTSDTTVVHVDSQSYVSGKESGSRSPNAATPLRQIGVPQDASAAFDGAKPPKSKNAKTIAIVLVAVCVAIAIVVVLAFFACSGQKGTREGTKGQLEGKTQEEIQAELDRVVQEGMFNISISSNVEFENGTSEGELRIENVPNNHYLMRVEIAREDTGDVIYKTKLIEPGYHIQTAKLETPLPAGTYPCTAVFYAYDSDTEEPVGQAAAKMTIKVLN